MGAPPAGAGPIAKALGLAMDRAGEAIPPAELVDDQAGAEDPSRAALASRIRELTPGPENEEVRRALMDSARDLLKTARVGRSPSPFDHVCLAIEKAAGNPDRRDSIESLARGILKNWAREGWPAVNAPAPPGLARRAATPDHPPVLEAYAVERRSVEAADAAPKARWEALPAAEREAIRAEVAAENPGLARWPNMLEPLCLARLAALGPP